MSLYNQDSKSKEDKILPLRIVTGGNDNKVKIWSFVNNTFKEENEIKDFHKNWVRDVAWLNYIGSRYDTIATCGEDKSLFIFKYKEGNWTKVFEYNEFNSPVLSVSWSHCGSYLAASSGNNEVKFFMESLEGVWNLINKIDDNGNMVPENLNENMNKN